MLAQLAGYYSAQGIARAEVVAALFGAGEQGALYDPSDLSTLYQDAGGAMPVTGAEQTAGLSLDVSQGLVVGPELFSGALPDKVFRDNINPSQSMPIGEIEADKLYRVRLTIQQNGSTISASFRVVTSASIRPATVIASSTNGDFERLFTVRDGGNLSLIADAAFVDFDVTACSLQSIAGYHAQQVTASARPLLRATPLRIDYDGVDDYLRTVFPNLGVNCTVGRALPGTGASILTGQTINGNYDDSTDHAGLVIVDRALTGDETDLLTRWLNQKAGV